VLELLREGLIEPDMAMGTAESLKTHPDLTERVIRLVRKGKINPSYLIMVGPIVDDAGKNAIAKMRELTGKPGRIPTLREIVGHEADIARAIEGIATHRIGEPFKANVVVAGPRDRFYISLNPTPEEVRGMLGRGRKKLPVWRFVKPMIGSVMLEPAGDALMVREIQTGMFERNLPSKLKRRYNKWPEIMMEQVEDYARRHGFTRIVMPTALAIYSHHGGMSPFTSHQLYTELPKRAGFSLKERAPDFSAMPHHMFWERKVPHGRTRNR
ncbi:hypothetical protein HYS54_03670, partial [Candidatus Micrarchaeota archaeon]|nr:hypothetical protein [Candidatus Micrarchaeota archaeon]